MNFENAGMFLYSSCIGFHCCVDVIHVQIFLRHRLARYELFPRSGANRLHRHHLWPVLVKSCKALCFTWISYKIKQNHVLSSNRSKIIVRGVIGEEDSSGEKQRNLRPWTVLFHNISGNEEIATVVWAWRSEWPSLKHQLFDSAREHWGATCKHADSRGLKLSLILPHSSLEAELGSLSTLGMARFLNRFHERVFRPSRSAGKL